MHSLRKWFYRPKKEDSSKLALFYWADEELTMVAAELDSFDGRTDPDRCSILVSQLRICQDKVLSICNDIMDDAIPDMRANRDFRMKFPDDVLHENLAGQLWFGAECLAAGSNIIHRELESASMRPLAKALTRSLENVRCLLREQSLKNSLVYSDKVKEALRIFDRLFSEFELCYVCAMVPIKSAKEYHLQQEIIVLFSETLIRALKMELTNQEMVDNYDPSLMFTIPRLAIIWGLLLFPDGPFNVAKDSGDISELFRPFCNLLFKIRDLLWTLNEPELHTLEKMLCSLEEPKFSDKSSNITNELPSKGSVDFTPCFHQGRVNSKQFIKDFYSHNFGTIVPESQTLGSAEGQNNNELETELQNAVSGCYKWDRCCVESEEIEYSSSSDEDSDVKNYGTFCKDKGLPLGPSSSRKKRKPKRKESSKSNSLKIVDNSNPQSSSRPPCSCSGMPKIVAENCPHCTNDAPREPSMASLEDRLSALHGSCNCGLDVASREHLTPSREIMRQVMRRVEIVPPGQQIDTYSSSVESSPRAYHHGLLSHSFPSNSASSVPHQEHRRIKRLQRRSNHSDCDNKTYTPKRLSLNYHKNTQASESWTSHSVYSSPLMIPRVQRLRQEEEKGCNSEATYSSCSSCQSVSSASSLEWNSTSPETSSYNSDCQDDEEIALALQAAEIASRNKARSRFKSSRDLLHKLFVCVSGVADQLQTNYASDLRNILKSVFDMNSLNEQEESNEDSKTEDSRSADNQEQLLEGSDFMENLMPSNNLLNNNDRDDDERDGSSVDSAEEVVPDNSPVQSLVIPELGQEENENNLENLTGPPEWMPDELSPNCMACKVQFTILRRRHHCRNCGKIFCSRCSSNSIPLPRFGHLKPVRVCNQCFMYQLTNLVMQRQLFSLNT